MDVFGCPNKWYAILGQGLHISKPLKSVVMEKIYLVYYHNISNNESVVVMAFHNEDEAKRHMNDRERWNTNPLVFYYITDVNLF